MTQAEEALIAAERAAAARADTGMRACLVRGAVALALGSEPVAVHPKGVIDAVAHGEADHPKRGEDREQGKQTEVQDGFHAGMLCPLVPARLPALYADHGMSGRDAGDVGGGWRGPASLRL